MKKGRAESAEAKVVVAEAKVVAAEAQVVASEKKMEGVVVEAIYLA